MTAGTTAASNGETKPVPRVTDDTTLSADFLRFIDASPSPYHAVASLKTLLQSQGFAQISERHDWAHVLKPGGRYFFISNGSSLVAFAVGRDVAQLAAAARENPAAERHPTFTALAAHTDSPCFKVKPVSTVSAHGYLQLGVECYGGGLWHTWFDRDLTVAGRAIVCTGGAKRQTRLVALDKPVLRIPNLAIHLSRNIYTEGFKPNKETDTTPILATELAASALNAEAPKPASRDAARSGPLPVSERCPPLLLALLAEKLGVEPGQIEDVDLCLADTQPCAIGGALDEFIYAPRLDNLASCFTGAHALVQALEAGDSGSDEADTGSIRILACFDHEEVGSTSSHGADSPLLTTALERLSKAFGFDYERAQAGSLLVSADMAHAIHPNYASKHEGRHRPVMGNGLVVKTNQNQRYATSGITGFYMRRAAHMAHTPLQEFVVPNDKPCGSTVGPLLASRSGLPTVDVGQAMLSMHSVREMCSVRDLKPVIAVLRYVMRHFQAIRQDLDDGCEPDE